MHPVDQWAAELALSCTPETVRAYTAAVRCLLGHAGRTDPARLDRADVVAWLGRPGITGNSRAAYLRRVRAWARWAGRPDLVDGVRAAPYRNPPVRVLTDGEVAAMAAACRGPEDGALLVLLAGLGLRRSEAARVRGEDFTGGHLQVVGKGGRVDRVPVDAAVRRAAGRMPRRGWWFPSGGGHVSAHAVARRVARIGRDAGCGHVTPHMLRRWMGTALSRGGCPLAVVQVLLRHADVSAGRERLPQVWAAAA